MIDAHIHIERGPYTAEWIGEFVETALSRGIDEIWLLEHCYRFPEFLPMYSSAREFSPYIDKWLDRKGGRASMTEYIKLADEIRVKAQPVKIKFGLEVCYFPGSEELVYQNTKALGLDFLVGSVHFVDGFAFDHKKEFWEGVDTDKCFARYFEISNQLAGCGLFDGIAHPDAIKLFGHKPSFSLMPYYKALARALAASGMYAEQNSGVSRRCGAECGMAAQLIAELQFYGVPIVTASDAHCPADVGLCPKVSYN